MSPFLQFLASPIPVESVRRTILFYSHCFFFPPSGTGQLFGHCPHAKGWVNSAVSPGILPKGHWSFTTNITLPPSRVCPNGGGNHSQSYGKNALFYRSVVSILKSAFQTHTEALKFCPVVTKRTHKWLKNSVGVSPLSQSLPLKPPEQGNFEVTPNWISCKPMYPSANSPGWSSAQRGAETTTSLP